MKTKEELMEQLARNMARYELRKEMNDCYQVKKLTKKYVIFETSDIDIEKDRRNSIKYHFDPEEIEDMVLYYMLKKARSAIPKAGYFRLTTELIVTFPEFLKTKKLSKEEKIKNIADVVNTLGKTDIELIAYYLDCGCFEAGNLAEEAVKRGMIKERTSGLHARRKRT